MSEIIKEQFEKFYKKIKLTKNQREDAQTKYTNVVKALHQGYYSSTYDGSTKLVFGSYGKHTNIRPPRDVDVLFKLPTDLYNTYIGYTSNAQSHLLQDIRSLLSEHFTTTEKIRAWGKVVLVEFADNTHNVEVLPGWENTDGTFIIPNTENGGSWEQFDPRNQINRINDQDKENGGITRKLIRMLKKWVSNCSIDLESSSLENYVIEYLKNTQTDVEIQTLIKDFFSYLSSVIDSENLSHVQTAYNRSSKACEYEKNGNEEEAIEEWIKIFGDNFPKTITKDFEELRFDGQIDVLKSQYPEPYEQYLDRDFDIQTNLNPDYHVKIDCEIKQNGFRTAFLSLFIRKGMPLQKEKTLLFKIIMCDVPKPYTIKWKVRNFGKEAQDAGELRGEITDGKKTKEEHTKFKGEHYVECYIIKDNICVAQDRIFVPIG